MATNKSKASKLVFLYWIQAVRKVKSDRAVSGAKKRRVDELAVSVVHVHEREVGNPLVG